MGYYVNIILEDVCVPKDRVDMARHILNDLNEKWQRTNDWCRFTESDDLAFIFESIGFEAEWDENGHLEIKEFFRESLGDHENMFRKLAPALSDCEIKFFGEDGRDWKIVVEQGFSEVVYREDF